MKRATALLLVLVMMFALCACGSAKQHELEGKYYWDDMDGVYYEFQKSKCYLVIDSINSKVEYLYAINDDYEKMVDNSGNEHITYVVHISDVNSSKSQKLVYDSYTDSVWDPDLGLFNKK